MIKRFIHWLLGYATIILLLGLGLLGMAAYTTYKASVGGKIPPEAELVVQSGKVVEGREVTVERRRRRSARKTTKKYYELDLKPADGDMVQLRVDFTVPRNVLEQIIDENVTVKYDTSDDNTIYVIQQDGADLVSYATMAEISQREADADKASFASLGAMGSAVVMVLVGVGGIFLRRKLEAGDESDDSEAHVSPSEVRIGADVADNTTADATTGAVFDKEAAFRSAPTLADAAPPKQEPQTSSKLG